MVLLTSAVLTRQQQSIQKSSELVTSGPKPRLPLLFQQNAICCMFVFMVAFLTDPPRRLYEYWLSLPKNGLLPPRSAVNPADIKDILPHLAIAEWNVPGEIKYRLAGTGVVERYGFDPTGRNVLDLIDAEEKTGMVHNITRIMGTPCGARSVRRESYDRDFQQLVEHAVFPIDSERDDRLLLIAVTGLLKETDARIKSGALSRMERPSEFEFIDIGAGVPTGEVIQIG